MCQKGLLGIVRVFAALILLVLFTSDISAQGVEVRKPFKIVHIGDSYSAGNAARSATGERNYYGVPGCNRSLTNWGNLYANSLQAAYSATYINRACSGAVINDVIHLETDDPQDPRYNRGQKMGEEKKIDGKCPTPKYPAEEYYENTSSDKCTRYLYKQISAIDESVDLVLMTLGGNDLHFTNIVIDCYSPLRSPGGCRDDVEYATGLIDNGELKANLVLAFKQIKEKLRPGAKILYLPYPNLALDEPYNNDPYWVEYRDVTFGIVLDRYDAKTAIRELSNKGYEQQKAAVAQANSDAGEEYIIFDYTYEPEKGTRNLFSGHEPHPAILEENPNRWIKELEGNWFSPLDRSEMYHPNPLGHYNWAKALSPYNTFGVESIIDAHGNDIDVAFVVDTTGSMGNDIEQVKTSIADLVQQLKDTTDSYRVAVISYRDFPERTGASYDYPSLVIQTFTSDPMLIQGAIDSLSLGYGGDLEETVFSGIQTAIDLPWRPGVTKITIVIGDAPPLSPEPYTNLTVEDLVFNSLLVDPVQVMGVDTGNLNMNGDMEQIATGTGGFITQSTSDVATKIAEILDQTARQPFAWLGTGYSGKIGQPVLFDASGSYDPSGSPITSYEWDFDGDGIFDLQTETATVSHVYEAAFDGLVVLRVTSEGGTALASVPVVVNQEGYVAQVIEETCALDEEGYSIVVDDEGKIIPCNATSIPESGREGVSEATTENTNLFLPLLSR